MSDGSVRLQSARYAATVSPIGASLRALTWSGRGLVVPWAGDEVRPRYRGAVLAPWPNRVAGGRWSWRNVDHLLPVNERARGHSLHGLVLWQDWSVAAHDAASVELTTRIDSQPGYPFRLDLCMTWSLGARGLRGELRCINTGPETAPYGCGFHPYLVAASGRLDDWTVSVPAARRLRVDERMLPLDEEIPPSPADFRAARPLGGSRIDHTYFDVAFATDDSAEVIVTDTDGVGTVLRFGRATPWVHLYTDDDAPTGRPRLGLAVEPVTCPPDAFNSGNSLVHLSPGQEHCAWWEIATATSPQGQDS